MRALILLVPSAALLGLGFEGLFHAIKGRETIAISCEEFSRARPSSPSVRVTGCDMNYAGAAYRESRGQIIELFVPARPTSQRSVQAPLVAAVHDPTALTMAQSVLGNGATPSVEQTLDVMRRIGQEMQLSRSIDGAVRAGVIERFRSRRILSSLSEPVAADATVVDVHGKPDLIRPSLALAGGLVLAAIPWLVARRRRAVAAPHRPTDLPANRATEPPDHRPAEQPSPPIRGDLSVMLPQLLLLNVDVLSGPEAIENAPPLGTKPEVTAILAGIVPDLERSGDGRLLARPDGSLKVDLGSVDRVATVVVEAHGEAGIALVKEILLMTGWRAFAPKTGLFITTHDLEALAALAMEGH